MIPLTLKHADTGQTITTAMFNVPLKGDVVYIDGKLFDVLEVQHKICHTIAHETVILIGPHIKPNRVNS